MKGLAFLGAVLAGLVPAAGAFAADPPVRAAPVYRATVVDTARVPACDDARVHRRITSRFGSRERGYWHSGLRVVGFAEVREIAYRPWGPEFIPRRFCEARTLVNDGTDRLVAYSIEQGTGFAGIGFGVEWCVGGLDRNLAYAPDCKMAGP